MILKFFTKETKTMQLQISPSIKKHNLLSINTVSHISYQVVFHAKLAHDEINIQNKQ